MSHQMQYQPAPPVHGAPVRALNGFGVTALVLGIIGCLSGIPMFLFWLAGPLGLLALIFGIAGLSRVKKGRATNKGVAITGTVLGILSLILAIIGAVVTLWVVNEVKKDVDEQTGSSNSITDLGAGEAAKYNNGLEVTVSKPTPFTVDPNTVVSGHTAGNKAWKVTVTIKNTGDKDFKDPLLTTDAEADGKKAEEVSDDKHGVLNRDWEKRLAPGESDSAEMVFDAPPTAKELEIKITPDVILDEANWQLPL
ncbi:DUF4190 domain-containing protein [Streptomyces sp. 3N207]|uniref:DUF4190 domain-containing protein n=1 Tax=Streptomyces sp. 3N207 TaxID=3457417 RepID=UPI003FCEF2B9